MDDLNVLNGTQEGVVDSPQEQVLNTESETTGEVANSTVETKPVQSQEQNAIYANIRRESEANAQKKIDTHYENLYGESHDIHSEAEYNNAVKAQEEAEKVQAESEKYNASPELIERLQKAEEKLNGYESEKQAREREESVNTIDKEADGILELAKSEGIEITKQQLMQCAVDEGLTDLKKAYKLLKPDVDTKTLKENAIKEYIEGRRTGKIPVEGSGNTPVVTNEAPKTFADARKGALEMLRASNIFNK